jgi:hypothetical protein
MGAGIRIDTTDSGNLQPFGPGRAVHQFHDRLVMEKIVAPQIGGHAQGPHSEQQARTAYQRIGWNEQSVDAATVVMTAPETDE